MQRWMGWSAVALVAAAALVWQFSNEPADSYAFKEGPQFQKKGYSFDTSHIAIESRDGRETFTVPAPGDREWEDYLEMKKHRQYQSFMDGRDGYAIPYDPEWRALVRGHRDAPPVDYQLVGTYSSLEDLAREVLRALHDKDAAFLREMHLRMEEFETVCWPSFPQSRPYVRVPVQEAWGLHFAACTSGLAGMMNEHGGRDLVLDEVEVASRTEYPPNFHLLDGVTIHAHDRQTNQSVTIQNVDGVIERDGRFKVYIFED